MRVLERGVDVVRLWSWYAKHKRGDAKVTRKQRLYIFFNTVLLLSCRTNNKATSLIGTVAASNSIDDLTLKCSCIRFCSLLRLRPLSQLFKMP